jgi:hypothetical protein
MKYIDFIYGNNSVRLTQNPTQSTSYIDIIDNTRKFQMTCIAPYCSMCGGTGRCGGSCNG